MNDKNAKISQLEAEVRALTIELRDTLSHPDDADDREDLCCRNPFVLKGWNGDGYEVGHWHSESLWLKNAVFPIESEAAQYVRVMNIMRWPLATPNAEVSGAGTASGGLPG